MQLVTMNRIDVASARIVGIVVWFCSLLLYHFVGLKQLYNTSMPSWQSESAHVYMTPECSEERVQQELLARSGAGELKS